MKMQQRHQVLVLACLGLLAPLAATTTLLVPIEAHAADIFPAAGVIELMPVGEVLGDGQTPVTLHFVALEPNGAAMTGIKGKVTAQVGSGSEIVEVGGGIYRFTYTPSEVAASRQVELTLKAKNAAKATLARVFNVVVNPPPSHRLALSANPPSIVLGQDPTATLAIQLTPAAGVNPADLNLYVAASAGEVANLTYLGDGRFTALYTPPKVNFPQVVILTAVDRRDPTRSYGSMSIALLGRTNFPVDAVPSARVVMRVGDRDFGPVPADASGKANIPITVPPGVEKALAIIATNDQTRQESVDLKVPETRRVAFVPTFTGIPLDGSVKIPIRVTVVTPTGAPASEQAVNLTASVGTLSPAVSEGQGVWRADYTPPIGGADTRVTFVASLASSSAIQTDTLEVPLSPVRPGSLTLSTEPAKLPQGATGFKLFAKALGSDGVGLAGRNILFAASGAKLRDSVKDMKSGDYTATFDTTGTGPVDLTATLQSPSTGNAFRRLLVLPNVDRIPNDGLSSSMLTVISVDEFGYPVADVPIALRVNSGDGSLPSTAKTNSAGIAQVYYTAGRTPGVIQIDVSSGNRAAGVALLQAPPDVLPGTRLPRSGSATDLKLIEAWSAIVRTIQVEREGAPVAAAAPVVVAAQPSGAVGAVTVLAVSSEPGTVAPGGTVTLKIQTNDAHGRGVGGQKFDIMPSTGTLGSVMDMGNGEYRVSLTVPSGISGEVKVSVVVGDGAAMGFLKLPVSTAPVNVWAAAPGPTTPVGPAPVVVAPTPVASTPAPVVTPPPPPKPKAPAGDHRWIRVRANVGTGGYHYEYMVKASPLPLDYDNDGEKDDPNDPLPYDKGLELSGDSASVTGQADPSALAVPMIDIRASGWVPMFQYVGFDVRYRNTMFGVQTDSFTQPNEGVDLTWIDHFVTGTLRGRYYHDVGPNRFWGGLAGGIVYTGIPLVTNWEPPGQNKGLWFFSWSFVSLYGGLQAGAEIGTKIDVQADFGLGTESYSGVLATQAGLDAAYELIPHLTLNLGIDYLKRDVVVPHGSADNAPDMLEAVDSRLGFLLGVGTAF
jgi:hypothetical protein